MDKNKCMKWTLVFAKGYYGDSMQELLELQLGFYFSPKA